MKRISLLVVLIMLTLSLSAWDGTVATSYAGGDGSAEHPYEIANAEQLALLAQRTNQQLTGDSALHYILTQDIDLLCIHNGDTINWDPIGKGPYSASDDRPLRGWKYFRGVFDGQNHTISNLYCHTDSSCVGLFGAAIYATFRNIRIVGADLKTSGRHVGSLCGWLGYNSQVTNVITEKGSIVGYTNVGGIVGVAKAYYHERYSEYIEDNIYRGAKGSITHCVNGNFVSNTREPSNGIDAVGGICNVTAYDDKGYIYIAHCDNYGTISAHHGYGGIVGNYFMSYGASNVTMIEYCRNYGQIKQRPFDNYDHKDFAGELAGICGALHTSSGTMGIVKACSNMVDINCEYGLSGAQTTGVCGGIVGLNQGHITQCCNVGAISAWGWTGGICGYNTGTISDCLNGGKCGDYGTQGICGINRATLLRCINTNFANSSQRRVNYETMGNAHFDKQMCWINPTTSYRHFTKEMLGTKLENYLGNQWVYTDGMYPRPVLLAETDEAYVAATPIYLEEYHYDPTGELPYDYTQNIQHCWAKLGQVPGVSWEIENPILNDTTYAFIQEDSLFVHGSYRVMAKVKKGTAARTIQLWFKNEQCDPTPNQEQDTLPDLPPLEEKTKGANLWYNGWLYVDITPEQIDSLVGGTVIEMDTLDLILPTLSSKEQTITPALVYYKENTPLIGIPLEQIDSITYNEHSMSELFFIVPAEPSTESSRVVGDCVGTSLTLAPQPMDKVVSGQWYILQDEQWVEIPTEEVFSTVQVEETPQTYQFRGFMMGDNLIENGDFEQGMTRFETDYQIVSDDPDNLGPEGTITVTHNIGYVHGDSDCDLDHTLQNRFGKMLAVNGNTLDGVVAYRYRMTQLQPNTDYALSTWATNWSYLAFWNQTFAQLKFCINGQQIGNVFMPEQRCDWERFYTVWNSGDNTEALFTIQDVLTESQGNDFALDDIFFAPLTPLTYTIRVIPYECPE